MSKALLIKLAEERDSLTAFIDETLERAATDNRDLVEAELRNLESTKQRIAEIDAQAAPLQEWEATRASAIKIDKVVSAPQTRTAAPITTAPRGDTLGALFVESDAYRSYSGGTGQRLTVDGTPVEIVTRAALTTTGAPGSFLVADTQKYVAPAASLITPLLDAIQTVGVNSGAVEIVKYGLKADGAAVVPEGSLKPEGTFEITSETVAMPTIAVSAFASRQLLRDAPQARQFIDSQLSRGVISRLEETVTGSVTGATIPTLNGAAGEEILALLRRGMAVVQVAGFRPTAVLANPGVLAALDLTVMGLGGASAAVVGSGYWGLAPISVPALGDDEIYVGAPGDALALFQRTGIEAYWSDSDVDDSGQSLFRRNILSTVVEMSAVAAVVNAAAMVKVIPAP